MHESNITAKLNSDVLEKKEHPQELLLAPVFKLMGGKEEWHGTNFMLTNQFFFIRISQYLHYLYFKHKTTFRMKN